MKCICEHHTYFFPLLLILYWKVTESSLSIEEQLGHMKV